jgi:hypothetical protein
VFLESWNRTKGPGPRRGVCARGLALGEPEHGAHPATPFQSGPQCKSCVFTVTVPFQGQIQAPGPFLKWALLNKVPQSPLSVSHTTGSLVFGLG